jgi:hypothetical protein
MEVSLIKEAVLTKSPLIFENNSKVIDYIDKVLFPYKVGMEIETSVLDYNTINIACENIKEYIPTIEHLDLNSGGEQRFRVSEGYKGLCDLYKLCQVLPDTLIHNTGSGIHYHIGINDVDGGLFSSISSLEAENILCILDGWNYGGSYNTRTVDYGATWLRRNGEFNTFEFRCANMKLNYTEIIKEVLDAQEICLNLKNNKTNKLHRLKNKLIKPPPPKPEVNIEELIKNRRI